MSPPRLIALVVTYNRLDQLQKTLARLLHSPVAELAGVLVVDNASTDGTGDWLAAQTDTRVQVLTLAENSGGAGGFHAGMLHAMAHMAPDWLLLMDDDARPHAGTLAAFQGTDRSTHEGWVAATYFSDGTICEMNRPVMNPFGSLSAFWATLRQGRAGYHTSDAGYAAHTAQEVDGASFVGFFVSKQAVELAGYPDADLFIYGDDTLYSLRLRACGARIMFDPNLRFEHDCGTEMGSHPITPLWKVYYMYRNQLLVYRAAAGPVLFWPIAALKIWGWWRKSRHYAHQRGAYQKLMRQAVKDGLRGRRQTSFAQIRARADAP